MKATCESGVRPLRGRSTIWVAAIFALVALAGCTTREPQQGAAQASSAGNLRDLQSSFRSIAENVLPSVVRIDVTSTVASPRFPFDQFGAPDSEEPRQPFESEGLGSGVVVSRDGRRYYVLTNDHVVGTANDITVVLDDGTEFAAELVGRDPRKDLAMVSFTALRAVPVATLGDSDALRTGDWVVAIGSPFGFQNTITVGIVSALGRSGAQIGNISDFIQTDAAINRGNSGGALVNLDGEVIGINTWITSETGVSAGLGFAIPINNVMRTMDTFLAGGEIEYGWLGVSIQSVENEQLEALGLPDSRGALVNSIFAGSPAQLNGILPGDFLVAIDGETVRSSDELVLRVGELPVGSTPVISLYRQGELIDVPVRIDARAPDAQIRQQNRGLWPGMSTFPVTQDLAIELGLSGTDGAVVSRLEAGSPADIGGIERFDVIQLVNERPVRSVLDFYDAISDDSQRELSMTVIRDGAEQTLTVIR